MEICMKATVIIPNYNGKAFMQDCLTALAAQNVGDFEVLVVDNASTDGSADGLECLCPGVRVLKLDKNYGIAGNQQKAIDLADGEYICLCDHDDIISPDAL